MNKNGYVSFDVIDWIFNVIFTLFLVAIIAIPFVFFISQKNKSEIEARMYNEKYGTHYTTHDFFWSGQTIKDYLNGGKQGTYNLNINGLSQPPKD